MDANQLIALALDPSLILKARGINADLWQRSVLFCQDRQILLNCCRQSGKSTVVSALALHEALFRNHATVLLLSPSQRQSTEIFQKVHESYNAIGRPVPATYETQLKIQFANGSRILCAPGKEQTIRGLSPTLLIIDEAARVTDDLYRSVRPMLAVSKGRLIALSTPWGLRGWFYNEWSGEGSEWKRVCITYHDCPRITEEFIQGEIKSMGQSWVDQEYLCLFTALEGLVYPDFENCLININTDPKGRPVGGIDFGWRNPFAAIWGVLDRDDVLWLYGERYLRETALHEHAKALSAHKKTLWHADPAGATEINELRAAGLTVRKGDNDIRLGIAAVTARMRTGRLKIVDWLCPNLCAEAKLYRYPSAQERLVLGEKPIDDHNHALGALRYLVSKIDSRFIAKLRKRATQEVDGPIETDIPVPTIDPEETHRAVHNAKPWLSLDNEEIWDTI